MGLTGLYSTILMKHNVTLKRNMKLVRDSTGQEIVSSARAFMAPDYEPPPKSIITFEGDDYEVITSARFDNPIAGAKPHHTEVTLK